MAEALLHKWGPGKFKPYSAGSMPKGEVNPLALETLEENNFKTGVFNLRSKSWDEFSGHDAANFDFVFTVCDNVAGETCPIWPGQPLSAHWEIEDPDRPDLTQEKQRRLFQKAYWELENRIKIFTSLSFEKLDKLALQKQLDEIGKSLPEGS